ncbi:MAG: 3-coathanger stack domain-containing protein, partial [Saprospiraceae bacterium]
LVFLSLSYNYSLSGSIPDFSHTPLLKYLYLSGNSFTGMVPDFSNLPNLWYLGLRSISQLQLPKFTNLPELIQLDISYSGFSFDDILPNLNIATDTFLIRRQNLYCAPNPITINAELGEITTIDLMVDDTVTSNIYQWYKNDILIANASNTNTLEITNFQESDKGLYKATITNPNAPDGSIVNSCTYSLAIKLANDDVCDATLLTLGQRDSSSFLGATVEINEPYAPGKDCAVNWCDTTLHGSVWYKFIAPAAAAVNIVVNAQTDHSDTKIALYSGIACTSASPFQNAVLIDANDDKPGNCCDGSIIAVACLTPGTTYFVQVDQYEAGQSDFNITVNALESCELACDLALDGIKISQDSCDGNGGYISTKVISPSGQLFMAELLDETGTPIDTSDHGAFFGHLNAGIYRIRATSLEAENCTVESDLIEIIATCEVEGCAPNLVIDVIEKELYHAEQTIISTATLPENHTATFKAGTSITLKAGFHAAGTFSASIEDCEATLLEEAPITEARIALNNTSVLKQTVEMKIYPNPFYEVTTIAYDLPNKGVVTLQVFDFMGKEIAILERDLLKEKGRYEINFQANQLTSGTYFVVLRSGEHYEVQKLMLLK